MAHSYEELKGMNVGALREIAHDLDHEAVQGATQMNKDTLLSALCTAFGIDAHVHHEVVGIDKAKVKAKIRTLKKKRDTALEAKDYKKLKMVRRQIHSLKRKIHQATV